MGKHLSKAVSLRAYNILMIIITFIILGALIVSLIMLTIKHNEAAKSTTEYIEYREQAGELENASDYLTEQVRYFVITGDKEYLDNYFAEANVSKRRDKALDSIKKIADSEAYKNLEEAMAESKALMLAEYHAMKLAVLGYNYDIANYPKEVKNYELTEEELDLSNDAKLVLAKELVLGKNYKEAKAKISEDVNECIKILGKSLSDKMDESSNSLTIIMVSQHAIIIVLMLMLLFFFLFIYINIISPLKRGVNLITERSSLKLEGVKEYRYFASEYNKIRDINLENNKKLEYEAKHDKLTGVYNRAGYYSIYGKISLNKIAYILFDVDNFKKLNDEFGHDIGDLVLTKVASVLTGIFNKNCDVFRIGGDEFSVLIYEVNADTKESISQKIHDVNYALSDKNTSTPSTSISAGVAFGVDNDSCDSLFKKADIALYETKKNGRKGVSFYNNTTK